MDESKIVGNVCELCNVPMLDEHSRVSHIQGKKHQLALHNKHTLDVRTKCSIFVTNIPNQVHKNAIEEFFTTYGEIVDFFLGDKSKFAIVQFRSEEVAQKLLQEEVVFVGRKLTIRPRRPQERIEVHDNESPTSHLLVIECLKRRTTFTDELNTLISLMVHPRSILKSYGALCLDLQHALREEFPDCMVYPFGSTTTNLDMKGSDVDAHIAIANRAAERNESDLVRRARKVLHKRNGLFRNIIAIPNAKTPIVKCVHIPTNIACDFNFKNFLGVFNSNLVSYYIKMSIKNIRPSLLLLKAWAKFHELIGANGKFSNYALTMMFIFYLQHPPYNLPPVSLLQAHPNFINMQDHWNGGFDANCRINYYNLEQALPRQLLLGFFTFYANFEYSLNVISPFCGRVIAKSQFNNINSLPNSLNLYKFNITRYDLAPLRIDTAICVQDPFELNYNTTRSVLSKVLDDFVELCKQGVRILGSSSREAIIYRLLTEECGNHKINFITNDCCKFKMIMSSSSLSYLDSELEGEFALKKAWFHVVNEFVLTILTKIMKFECSILLNDVPAKVQRMEGQSDVYDKAPLETIWLKCLGKHNVWEVRKSVAKDIVYDESCKNTIDRQIFITNYIINILLKDVLNTIENVVDCVISLNACENPTCIEIVIERNEEMKMNAFRSFVYFIAASLPKWFEAHERELHAKAKEKEPVVVVVE